jgi:hypothetical protein
MAYTIIDPATLGIEARDPELCQRGTEGYAVVAPGLYPDEAVAQLDSGELVAISVEEDYVPTTLGVSLCAVARVIEADGSTKQAPDLNAVEVSFPVGVSKADLDARGLDAYRREVLLAVLGEPATMRPIDTPADAVPITPEEEAAALDALRADGKSPEATLDVQPLATEEPLLRVGEQQRESGNVRNALTTLAQLAAAPDPGSLL